VTIFSGLAGTFLVSCPRKPSSWQTGMAGHWADDFSSDFQFGILGRGPRRVKLWGAGGLGGCEPLATWALGREQALCVSRGGLRASS
jgi:hypothetical protein